MVKICDSLDLTMLKALSYFNGARIQLDDTKMKELENKTYIEEKEDLCFGLTIRLYEVEGTYLIIFGQASKDEWYEFGLVIHKHKVDPFPVDDFERPETH